MSTPEQENQPSFLIALVKFFEALTSLTEELITLAKWELRLAGKSLLIIIAFYCAIGFFFVSAWFFILAALAVLSVVVLKTSWPIALLMVAGFNFLLILITAALIAKYKRYLAFPAMRRQLNL